MTTKLAASLAIVALSLTTGSTALADETIVHSTDHYVWWAVPLDRPARAVEPNEEPNEDVVFTESVPDQIIGVECDVYVVNNESIWLDNIAYIDGFSTDPTPPGWEAIPNHEVFLGSQVMGSTVELYADINTTNGPLADGLNPDGSYHLIRGFSSWDARFECVIPEPPEPPLVPTPEPPAVTTVTATVPTATPVAATPRFTG